MTRPVPIPESEFAGALRAARAGRFADAIAEVERLTAGETPGEQRGIAAAEALAHVARLAEAAGDAGQGERALSCALGLRPDYPDFHFRRARLLTRLQKRAEARRALDRALELNPRYTAARLERALLDAADGFIGESLEALRARARDTEVGRPGVFQQGLESLERADWEEAGALFTRALELDESPLGGALEQARALLEEGEAERAAEVLRAALPEREGWPDLHFLLGSAELRQGHFDDALGSLARALELNPDFHAARPQFALALEATGASAQAGEQLALVLQCDPAHPQALELQRRWDAIGRRHGRVKSTHKDA